MLPIVVRHKPRARLVDAPDICAQCGGLGHYFIINAENPEDTFTIDCDQSTCADHNSDGIPDHSPNNAVTEPLAITHDGDRGICYGHKRAVRTGNSISGTIDGGCPPRKKMP